MSDKVLKILRWTCLLLAGMVGWQVYGLVTAPEPFDPLAGLPPETLALDAEPPSSTIEEEAPPDDAASEDSAPADESSGGGSSGDTGKSPSGTADKGKNDGRSNGADAKKDAPSHPPFPPAFEVIATSGVFGMAPKKKPPPPALLGTIGKYAMIRSPDGKEDLVAEGGELGGVKVIRISTNRVLIEYQDQRTELTVYAGTGSAPLLETEKKKEEKKEESDSEKREEQKKADAPGNPTSSETPPNASAPAAKQ